MWLGVSKEGDDATLGEILGRLGHDEEAAALPSAPGMIREDGGASAKRKGGMMTRPSACDLRFAPPFEPHPRP